MTQAIADVERMEREEQANRKALLEAKALLGTKVDDIRGAGEDVKTLMEMPVVVEDSVPEPHAVAQVIEVPAQGPSAGNLDIIIVDSSTLGGQEEVPPDGECQVVEVMLDPKNSDGNKQDVPSEDIGSLDSRETVTSSGEKVSLLSDKKVEIENEPQDGVTESKDGELVVNHSPDGTVVSETVTGEDASVKELGMDEESRIAVVAIEIPTSKAEEKEICKNDKNEELNKQKEQRIKKDEGETMVEEEVKRETPSVETTKYEEAANSEDQKVKYEGMKELPTSEGQCLEKNENMKEVAASDVKRGVVEESLENKAEETVETEKDADDETADGQCVVKKEGTQTAEHIQESAKQSEEESEKRDTEAENLITEKISEATEEEDSHAESSEDEKKTDEKADRVEEENSRLTAFCFLVYFMIFYELHKLFITENCQVFELHLGLILCGGWFPELIFTKGETA